MNRNDRSHSRKFFEFPDPPWFAETPELFNRAARLQIFDWFAQISKPLAVLLLARGLQEHPIANWNTRDIARMVVSVFTIDPLVTLEELQAMRRTLRGDDQEFHHNVDVFSLTRDFMQMATQPCTVADIAKQYWYLMRNIAKLTYLSEGFGSLVVEMFHSSPHRRHKVWRADWQHEVITEFRGVFPSPEGFKPSSIAEWLIAADMFEEMGDNRCRLIRLAANGENEREIFTAVYEALPHNLLH